MVLETLHVFSYFTFPEEKKNLVPGNRAVLHQKHLFLSLNHASEKSKALTHFFYLHSSTLLGGAYRPNLMFGYCTEGPLWNSIYWSFRQKQISLSDTKGQTSLRGFGVASHSWNALAFFPVSEEHSFLSSMSKAALYVFFLASIRDHSCSRNSLHYRFLKGMSEHLSASEK